jgi:hypothetical protein
MGAPARPEGLSDDLEDRHLCWMRHTLHFLTSFVGSLASNWDLNPCYRHTRSEMAMRATLYTTCNTLLPQFCRWTDLHRDHVTRHDRGPNAAELFADLLRDASAIRAQLSRAWHVPLPSGHLP